MPLSWAAIRLSVAYNVLERDGFGHFAVPSFAIRFGRFGAVDGSGR